jgi:NitT/TauT family transport system substrate-binding protein
MTMPWPRLFPTRHLHKMAGKRPGSLSSSWLGFPWLRECAAAALLLVMGSAAMAEDAIKVAIGQRGGWEQCVSQLGQERGIFKRHGLSLDILYTQGSAETLQAVISNSVDIGVGMGTHATLGAFVKGAPVRGIGASFTSADEQFYYVPTDSLIRGIKDADGKTIAVSTTGSASHMFALALGRHFGVTLRPQPTGAYAATLTQTLTRQVDIGFSQAPFNLNYVDDGRIRIIARGSDVPELRDMTSRLIVVNAATLERRRDVLRRFMAAYRETLDWLYADPQAINAYATWSGLPEAVARRAPEFMTRHNMEPTRMAGLEGIMRDAVAFKYIPAPLTQAQIKEAMQVEAVR